MTTDNASLGPTLRELREFSGKTLKAVAEPSGISTAYLQKLERGEVKSPSPKVLYGLAETLGADYLELMRRAGYVVPGGTAHGNTLAHALSPEGLTAEEAEALTTYLQLLRHKQRQRNSVSFEMACIPVVFTHYGHGEVNLTTAMPQIPAEGQSVSFGREDIPTGRVFNVMWCYSDARQAWHAEVAIR